MRNHLFIGLGGQGGRSLQELKKVMASRSRDEKLLKEKDVKWDFLSIDSSPDVWNSHKDWTYFGQDLQLDNTQKLLLETDNIADDIEDLAVRADIAPWIGDTHQVRDYTGGESVGRGANQKRRFGRLLFALGADRIRQAIFYDKVDGLTKERENTCWFHIFASIAGGTGSGGIIDLVSLIREHYPNSSPDRGFPIFLHLYTTKDEGRAADVGYFYQNQYATLRDLNALMTGNFRPTLLGSQQSGERFSGSTPVTSACLITSLNSHNRRLPLDMQIRITAESVFERIYTFDNNELSPDTQKGLTFEDIVDAFPGEPIQHIERTYRFATLGMRKWEVPNEKLEEMIALDLLNSSLCQMLSNNWQDSIGFVREAGTLSESRSTHLNETFLEIVAAKSTERRGAEARHRMVDQLSEIVKGIKVSDDSLSDLESGTSEFLNASFEGKGIKDFFQNFEIGRRNTIDETIDDIDIRLTGFWLDTTNSLALTDVFAVIDRLILTLRGDLEESGGNSTDFNQQRRVARKGEWEKITLLSKPVKAKALLNAHFNDLLRESLADFDRRVEQEDHEFKLGLINQLETLRVDYADARSVFETLLKRSEEDCESIESELKELQDENGANQYEFDQAAVIKFRDALKSSERHQRSSSNQMRANAARTQPGFTLRRFRDEMERKREKLDDELRLASLKSVKNIHTELTQERLAPKVLGDSLFDRLERRFQGNESDLQVEAKRFLDLAASCCLRHGGELQPSAILKGKKKISPMPKRLFVLGVPNHKFAKDVRKAFKKAIPPGDAIVQDLYEHNESAQLRLLVVDYWMAARFADVAHGLQDQYGDEDDGGGSDLAVNYFCNIDKDGEENKRSNLFLPSAEERRRRLEGEVWVGRNLDPPVILEDDKGVFLIQRGEEGVNPDRLGDETDEIIQSADIPLMFKINGVVGDALAQMKESEKEGLRKQVADEEARIEEEFKVTSPEFAKWAETRSQINKLLG